MMEALNSQVGDGEKFSKTSIKTEIIVNAVVPMLQRRFKPTNVFRWDIDLSNLKILNKRDIGEQNDITDLLDDVENKW